MPWRETGPEDERQEFIAAYLRRRSSISELCRAHGISRKTGHKWIGRFASGGLGALAEMSRARLTQAHRVSNAIAELVIEARKRHPTWGPKKLVASLGEQHPTLRMPAPSTAGDILKRAGLIEPRRRRNGTRHSRIERTFSAIVGPNSTWYADHKGWFRLRDGSTCHPGTITDGYSRRILRCDALASIESALMKKVFRSAFLEFGLPDVIRTDNGSPFGSQVGGIRISSLSVWFIELGVLHEFIRPAHPQENGSHERMHRTLKAETVAPVARDMRDQQRRFDRFIAEFNGERPHEALGQRTPNAVYVPSRRRFESFIPEPKYASHLEIRRVSSAGMIKWRGRNHFISIALTGKLLGCETIADGLLRIQFHSAVMGMIDEADRRFVPNPDWSAIRIS